MTTRSYLFKGVIRFYNGPDAANWWINGAKLDPNETSFPATSWCCGGLAITLQESHSQCSLTPLVVPDDYSSLRSGMPTAVASVT